MLAETCVASNAFIDSLQEKALAEARSAAEEAIRQRKASQAAASTSSEGKHHPFLEIKGCNQSVLYQQSSDTPLCCIGGRHTCNPPVQDLLATARLLHCVVDHIW